MSYKSYCKNVIGRFCCWPFVRQNYLNKCGMDHPKNICKQNNGKTVKARVFFFATNKCAATTKLNNNKAK
jgi:hypothetical protein